MSRFFFFLLAFLALSLATTIADDESSSSSEVDNHQYIVKDGIFPMTFNELMGSTCIIIVVGVGQAAGAGGGLVVVPLLMTFFGYEAKKSIALVFVCIFGASIVNIIAYINQREEKVDPNTKQIISSGPIIDYRIVLVSLPTVMVGSIYGVALNKFLPQIAISVLLVLIILQSLSKTYKFYRKEKAKEISGTVEPTIQPKVKFEDVSASNTCTNIVHEEQFPKSIIAKIVGITLFFTAFSLLRGGSHFESILGIPPCGIMYHLTNLSLFVGSIYAVKLLIAQLSSTKKDLNSSLLDFELQEVNGKGKQLESTAPLLQQVKTTVATASQMMEFAKLALFAGIIGSVVGIGGGMVLIPKWLESGMPTNKTAPCSISLLLFTAFNSLVQFSLSGVFTLEEILFFTFLALLSSFLVSNQISDYVKRTNQPSLLILILLSFMILALSIFSTLTIIKFNNDPEQLYQFGDFC